MSQIPYALDSGTQASHAKTYTLLPITVQNMEIGNDNLCSKEQPVITSSLARNMEMKVKVGLTAGGAQPCGRILFRNDLH